MADKNDENKPTDNSGVKMTGHFLVDIDFAPSLEITFFALSLPIASALSVCSKFLRVVYA